jgi:NTP pyrophosphatase (non-canonical NTP hydrolase)
MHVTSNSTTTEEGTPSKTSVGNSLGWVIVPSNTPDVEGLDVESIRYSEFVDKLFKKLPSMIPFKADLAHAALGVCGEAGELADAIKKHIIYGKVLDRGNVIEELGDVRFFLQAIQNVLNISEAEVLQHNAVKLSQRYKSMTYTDEAAIARADKTDGDKNA